MQNEVILSVENLKKYYIERGDSLFGRNKKTIHAVDDISFTIQSGQTLGLVGESGCGKSTTGRQVAGIEKPTSGEIVYRDLSLTKATPKEISKIRTQIQMIFQDSYASLNPRKRIYDIIAEPMLYHGISSKEEASDKVASLLEEVGLPKDALMRYPHEFSGGQRQRISIARALSLNPELIVCDEPVSALDVSVQAQILNLLKDLQETHGVSYLFIAHGLGAVRYISHRIAVMYLGKIVEIGDSSTIFSHPLHPYSQSLIAAHPVADPTKRNRNKTIIQGEIPSLADIPVGCRFAPRCPFASEECLSKEPALMNVSKEPGHLVACFRKVEP